MRLLNHFKRPQPQQELQDGTSTLAQELLAASRLAGLQVAAASTARRKARILVQAVQDDTLACIRAQRHLFGAARDPERVEALRQLALSFYDGAWCPEGLTKDDITALGEATIENLVWAVNCGESLLAYEVDIHARFQRQLEAHGAVPSRPALPAAPSLPALRPERRSRLYPPERAGTHRRLQQS